jgi:branched-chain amino acid aminotransferase
VGTAAEVSAINSVDDRAVPCPGPITQQVADLYGRAVRGQVPQYKKYCELA